MKKTFKRIFTTLSAALILASMLLTIASCGKDGDLDGSDIGDLSEIGNAPDFTVLDYDGNEVKLSDFRGKPVVLNFWATWCIYCTLEMPDFEEARKTYPDVQFVMVNATDGVEETVEVAKEFIENKGYGFDVFFDVDGEAVEAYRVTAFPMTVFIDSFGNMVANGKGMMDYEMIVEGIEMIA